MNERQKILLEFLKKQDSPLTAHKITHTLGWEIPIKEYQSTFREVAANTPSHDRNARKYLTADIRAINNDSDVEVIILSTSKGIKIANEQEFGKYISRKYASLWKRKKRLDKILKKAGLDEQGYITGVFVKAFFKDGSEE